MTIGFVNIVVAIKKWCNPHFIRMKSSADSSGEIKSACPYPRVARYHHEVIYPTAGGFLSPSAGITDIWDLSDRKAAVSEAKRSATLFRTVPLHASLGRESQRRNKKERAVFAHSVFVATQCRAPVWLG